jgi:hypothetical protein
MREMSRSEWRAFVSEGTRTAKLAVPRKDGRPHVVPIWFVLDGDDVVFNTGASTIKGRSLRRDGRISLCVDDQRPPFSYVTIEGRASVSEDPEEVLRFATLIGSRYMGANRAEEFGRRNGVPGELVVRLRPDKVLAAFDMAG